MAYRVYVTDSLKMLTGSGERYLEWVNPQIDNENRTANEIKTSIFDGIAVLSGMEKQNGLIRPFGEDNA